MTRTMAELRRDLTIWQPALGLQHWRIRLKRGKSVKGEAKPFSAELPEKWVAATWWTVEDPNVVIAIRCGEGTHTLVHELLHLRLEGHRPCPARYNPHYERALNHLSEALLSQPDLLV